MEKDEEFDHATAKLDSDEEGDELAQDWSQMAKVTVSQNVIPKRGEKDFEPDGTNVQELMLFRAKKAMFDSLSGAIRGSVVKNLVKAYYVPEKHMAVVPHPKGTFMHTMGRVDSSGCCWLEVYEFVYLAERGTVTPYWQNSGREDDEFDVPLSVEDTYSLFKSQSELDEFFVYAHLKRLGFIVSSINQNVPHWSSYLEVSSITGEQRVYRYFTSLFRLIPTIPHFSIYDPYHFYFRRYTSSGQIYRSLNLLIPSYSAPRTVQELCNENADSYQETTDLKAWKISFNVWKPRTNFRKKSPGLPDFQIVVYNKNESGSSFPTYPEIRNIFQRLNYQFDFLTDGNMNDVQVANKIPQLNNEYKITKKEDESPRTKENKKNCKTYPPHIQQLRRLKKGYRSFVLAVMDDGLISFVRLSESDFGSENVWYEPNAFTKKSSKSQRPKRRPKKRSEKTPE
ncbi:LAFE_0G14466g1_1 [Lachancea fermentati]|uniref:LAFE_0G14466g1_1 n=1 Tax=Lachancea fermentati TaxID=4955 RepID=A0A1G4MI84_LACFM|nr:LAFE_0G14466g1_1 [Lachancea fermentati]